jgi:hypothetical protein
LSTHATRGEDGWFPPRWLAAVVATGALSAGVAIAAQTAETSPVTAEFQASPTSVRERECDANHTKFRVKFEGSQTSSDPRLTGDLEARVRSVVNTENGYGHTKAKIKVTDPATGKPKLIAFAVGVIEPDGGVEGFITGRTVGPDSVKLLGNFNAQQDPATGALTGELGQDSQTGASQDPAILTNACRGGHGKHDDHGHRGDNGHRRGNGDGGRRD